MEIKRWNYKETPRRNQRLVACAPPLAGHGRVERQAKSLCWELEALTGAPEA